MHAATTQQFLHGDCIEFSLVMSRHCMPAGLRHIAQVVQNSNSEFKGTGITHHGDCMRANVSTVKWTLY